MNTITKTSSHTTYQTEKKTNTFLQYAEAHPYGIMSMLLIFVGCLSGITVGLRGFENDLFLIAIIIPTMTTLALILSVQPIKYILAAGIITAIVDLLILLTLLF